MKQYIELQKKLLGDVKPVTTKKVDPDDPDDLFMTEEEYQEMRVAIDLLLCTLSNIELAWLET